MLQQLQGDLLARRSILRQINLAHATGAERPNDPISTKVLGRRVCLIVLDADGFRGGIVSGTHVVLNSMNQRLGSA